MLPPQPPSEDEESYATKDDARSVSNETWRRVMERDAWTCQFCGWQTREDLHLHHLRSRYFGGGHEEENLLVLCWRCHLWGVHKHWIEPRRIAGQWYFRILDATNAPRLYRISRNVR